MSLVLINGVIYSERGREEAVVIRSGKIEYVGTNEDAIEVGGSRARIIDLRGSVVLPGIVDAHVHLDEIGLSSRMVDLRGARSIGELKEKVRQARDKGKIIKGWIIGRGWDHELFKERRMPTRYDIDQVCPDIPTLLIRVCGHVAVANTKALKISGIMNKVATKNVEVDEKGIPTGVIFEDEIGSIMNNIPKMSVAERAEIIEEALNMLASHGVTAVGFMSCTPESFEALQILKKSGRLPIRVMVYFTYNMIKYLKALRLRGGYGNDMLRIMGIKIFMDGSLGGRTAFLREPYSDSNTKGILRMNKKEVRNILEEAHSLELQVAIHAIGDGAIEEALNAIEDSGIDGSSCRIEHASVVNEEIIKRMKKLSITAVVQPHFIISDWWIVQRLGTDRARWAYAFKSMIDAGVKIAFSTDAPVEPVNPWLTIYAAVTRGKYENLELYKYTANECLTFEEALECYTNGSRRALSMKEVVLREGMIADLTIVDRDPYAVSVQDLKRVKNVATIVNGRIVNLSL